MDPGLKKLLEFYFCDFHLRHDKFMLKTTQEWPEGWVPMQVFSIQ